MSNVVIVSAKRTPVGSFQGGLSSLRAPDIGAVAIESAIKNVNIKPSEVDEVIMGCVLSAGIGQNPARQAEIFANIPNTVPAFTVNKVCSSGLLAVILAERLISSNYRKIVVAGGMESMSNAPYTLPKARSGFRLGDGKIVDSLVYDGLWDYYSNQHMGVLAENTAEKFDVSRKMQDDFAIMTYKRAQHAIQKGYFKNEIVNVEIPQKKGASKIFDTDEEPARAIFEKFSTLPTPFKKDGTVTAANSSSISDGASALVIMSEDEAKKRGLKILAKIVAHATNSHEPEWFTTAPIGAISKVLDICKWKTKDVDLFEINEAFSVVTLVAMKELNLTDKNINIHGGAVALGHPIGASGARILTTLVHAMNNTNAKKGIATLCNGGGEATAIAVEKP